MYFRHLETFYKCLCIDLPPLLYFYFYSIYQFPPLFPLFFLVSGFWVSPTSFLLSLFLLKERIFKALKKNHDKKRTITSLPFKLEYVLDLWTSLWIRLPSHLFWNLPLPHWNLNWYPPGVMVLVKPSRHSPLLTSDYHENDSKVVMNGLPLGSK